MKKNFLLVQMSSIIGEIELNYKKAENLIEKFYFENKDKTLDVIVLPEVWTTGWLCSNFSRLAESSGRTEEFLSNIAKKYNVNVIGGSYIRKIADLNKNTCPCFDRNGELIARYEKIHLYAPDGEAEHVASGKNPIIVNIEGINIGLSICYDIRFPELFRSYINCENPPELLINMSAWPMTRLEQYIAMSQSRAVENQAFFMALSQTGLIQGDVYNSGNSLVCAPLGQIIYQTDEKEGTIFAELDFDEVLNVRKTYPNISSRKVFDFGFDVKISKGAVVV